MNLLYDMMQVKSIEIIYSSFVVTFYLLLKWKGFVVSFLISSFIFALINMYSFIINFFYIKCQWIYKGRNAIKQKLKEC